MGKSQGSQTVTQQTKLPQWYTKYAKQIMNQSNNAAQNLAQPYMGNTVADLNDWQKRLIRQTQGNVGSTNQSYGRAMNATQDVMNYNPDMVRARQQKYNYRPDQVKAGSFLDANIDKYMNPYIRNVENQAMSRLDDQRLLTQSANADAAAAAGAFGGSRQGIREALTDAETSRSMGELSANLRNQGYNTASGLIMQDLGRGMQADMANQQANLNNAQFGTNVGLQNIANDLNAQQFNSNIGLQGQQLNLAAANQYGDQATQKQDAYLQSLQSAMAAAGIQQQHQQDVLDQNEAQYNAMRNYPLEQLNIRLAALGGTQVPTSSSTTQPTTGNPWLTALGAAGTAAGGFASLLPLLGFSDERAKTNIEPLGIDGMTGLPIYAYDYKSDVQSAKKNKQPMPPKRVGPMAQDIEKVSPNSVASIGGKKVIVDSSRVAPEGQPYLGSGNMDPNAYTLESMIGRLFGAQDWKNNYPVPAGGKTDKKFANFGMGD